MLKKYIYIFLISMVPLIELRGAVPVSQVMGLPIVPSFIVCIIANMLPVPNYLSFCEKGAHMGSRQTNYWKVLQLLP